MLNLSDVKTDVVLAPYSTYKIGGKADYFYVADSKEKLANAVIFARKEGVPFFVLGAGANILFGDKGYRGLVVKNEAKEVSFDGNRMTVESGATIAGLIKLTAKKNLSGLEHFAGIPSTVGGALWQNLHFLSPDRQSTLFIGDIVQSATLLDEDHDIITVDRDFFRFGYDYSILHDRKLIVLETTLNLTSQASEGIRNQIQENLKWRNEKQPQLAEFPSCGSVFKKISGVGAGRLIEKSGLKGHIIGGAQISPKHANYIVNLGTATAQDVVFLIKLIQEKVKKNSGYELETEISLVGEF